MHPAFQGASWKLVQPYSLDTLQKDQPDAEELVIFDELGAGLGSMVGISEGAEATMPFRPDKKPLDAYCTCILDSLQLSAVSYQPSAIGGS
jgi:ethanolamine utilization protein EutN